MKPLKPFNPFEDAFPALFRGVVPLWKEPIETAIALDVTEGDKAYTVKADLPGVKKEDIFVDVDGDTVTIRAEVKRELENREGETIHKERFEGVMSRSFSLPLEVEREAASAKYENGVLWLTLPKKAGESVRRVAIN